MDNVIFVGIIVFVIVMYIAIDIIRICKCQRYDAIENQINTLTKYASGLVAWADYFMKNNTGDERMQEVLIMLKEFCKRNNMDFTDIGLMSIVQNCYNKLQIDKALIENGNIIIYKEQSPSMNLSDIGQTYSNESISSGI